MSTGQTNTSTPMAARRSGGGLRELQTRQQALYDAEHQHAQEAISKGALSVANRGIFGLPGLALSNNAAQEPVITAVGQDIELKSGTQIVLRLDDSVLQQ